MKTKALLETEQEVHDTHKIDEKINDVGVFKFFGSWIKLIFEALFGLVLNIITLNNMGKWISFGTLLVVLFILIKFIYVHQFSVIAMELVIPYLGQLATLVFGVIAGIRGAQSIIDKVQTYKNLEDTVKNFVGKKDK